jgi:hypothetical protein
MLCHTAAELVVVVEMWDTRTDGMDRLGRRIAVRARAPVRTSARREGTDTIRCTAEEGRCHLLSSSSSIIITNSIRTLRNLNLI